MSTLHSTPHIKPTRRAPHSAPPFPRRTQCEPPLQRANIVIPIPSASICAQFAGSSRKRRLSVISEIMATSCEFILEFIDQFKRSRCLWQVGHDDYRSKVKRVAALEELLALYRTVDPDATRHTVQTKINSLRGAFKKELNKVCIRSLSLI